MSADAVARLELIAETEDWNKLVETFMTDCLLIPLEEVNELQGTPIWSFWTADARASLGDLRALIRHQFAPEHYRTLTMPVLLLVGTDSPRELYVTDALAGSLPDSRVVALDGQAHEGMTTAPELFVDAVVGFLANGRSPATKH